MIEIGSKKIGLVLSGGGAKGAYQVGMFKAFEELGIAGNISAMSGCSIGAYAEVIYAMKGLDAYREFLYRFPDLLKEGNNLSSQQIEWAKEELAQGRVSLERFVSDRQFWQHEALGIHRYIKDVLAGSAVKKSGISMSVCGYSLEAEKPVYFKLNELTDEEKELAVIGSGSLQFLFKPSFLRGHHLTDGGLVPDICANPAPADKIPLKPILTEAVDIIIVNFLIAQDSVDTSLLPEGCAYAELRPSVPLEAFPGAGTLDFTPEKLMSHERLGYADTIRFCQENFIMENVR